MSKSLVLVLVTVLVTGAGVLIYTYYPLLKQYIPITNLPQVSLPTNNTSAPSIEALNLKPVTFAPSDITLSLSSPDDNILVTDSSLLLQGKTTSKSTVVVSFEASDLLVDISPSGEFSTTIFLDEGVNQFTVTAFDDQGNLKQEERMVYYSKEKL